MIRVAAAAYPLDWTPDWDAYTAKIHAWVAEADADLLVFPEYGAMELAAMAGVRVACDLEASLGAVSERHARATEVFAAAAQHHDCHILMPSAPVFESGPRPVNRATLVGPSGIIGVQDKQVMTPFERDTWGVVAGGPLRIFDVCGARVGVLICYDAEFPQLGRALSRAGVDIVLVPSCTDALVGYSRVRIGAMARALESQCVVAQAPTVGPCDWSPAVDQNVGAAAIYGPPDHGFPSSGVLAEGAMNTPGWVRATVDLAAIEAVRRDGQVLGRAHWEEASARAKVL